MNQQQPNSRKVMKLIPNLKGVQGHHMFHCLKPKLVRVTSCNVNQCLNYNRKHDLEVYNLINKGMQKHKPNPNSPRHRLFNHYSIQKSKKRNQQEITQHHLCITNFRLSNHCLYWAIGNVMKTWLKTSCLLNK